MIRNDQQLRSTKEWLLRFEQSVAEFDNNESLKEDKERWQLHRDSYQSQVDELKSQIAEYEALVNHDYNQPIVLKVDDINHLPEILIKARMAAKLTQKELSDLAGLTEEKINFYEDHDYQGASFLEVLAVFDALDIRVEVAKFLVPLDTLRRTPITKDELLGRKRSMNKSSSS
ncbi:MAG: helix-turn-helix domain-containing protein [Scytonematopsis contorta HA4267-MV1]|nr:helix-turn-helix domain-containing protein [Scytonematopsis contorta HA4267-MV1]